LLSNSFFVFGARGTGKSTLVKSLLAPFQTLYLDLLRYDDEERLMKNPMSLETEIHGRLHELAWVMIDEVQKVPKILDIVHSVMETDSTRHLKFALTGSSARKLKIAGANLLAGRAFVNELYPLTHEELGGDFVLEDALNWGTLPKSVNAASDQERQEFLRTYARTYIKEEVWDERLVHNLDPFRKFLEIAAQSNGTIINYSALARQTGVDDKTVKKYFEILADTFLGFYLEGYHRSVRTQQIQAPKFYLFDPGVKRAMEGLLQVPIVPKTYAYGRAFEHFVICECIRLNSYRRLDYRFSYLKTKGDVEIDLVIERPGKPLVLVEIKSAAAIDETACRTLRGFRDDFPGAEFHVWSNDSRKMRFQLIDAMHWRDGLKSVGL
jgi:predicted AAA+ superfamily ATPase